MKYALPIIGLALILFTHQVNTAALANNQVAQHSAYLIGTYADAKNQGIELLSFDQDNMTLSTQLVASEIKKPSFVVANNARKLIFSVEDTMNGKLKSFALSQSESNLTLLDQVDSFGDHPCYLALDAAERLLAVANYGSGNFSIYEVDSTGGLHFKQSVQHLGSSINKYRQNNAHAHSMVFHPNGKQLLVADLGTDKIYIYDLNYSGATLVTPANPAYFSVAAGSGPRHMVLHPNGKLLYLVHELTGEVGVYFYDNGNITHANTQSLVTSQFKGDVQAAEIRLSSDGKFIYVSNRGQVNNLSVFEVGLEGGLRLIQQIATGGQTPRNFNLSPDGYFLLVANQDSDDIRLFKRDPVTGILSKTPTKIQIKKPTYIFPLH